MFLDSVFCVCGGKILGGPCDMRESCVLFSTLVTLSRFVALLLNFSIM